MKSNDNRLDLVLMRCGLAASRSRARDLIRLGQVRVNGRTAVKAGATVPARAAIEIAADANPYVSRGGLKLAAALEAFNLSPAGRVALDIGASTGGFTQVLLARGAKTVYAVDVGHGQLHEKLRGEPRVVELEGTDARDLSPDRIKAPVTAITADVSFISLTLALPKPLALAAPGCWLIALIKPQFEAGRQAVGKRGIVARGHHPAAIERVTGWLASQTHWKLLDVIPSPIAGKDGNGEFLLGAQSHG